MIWWLLGGASVIGLIWLLVRIGALKAILSGIGELFEGVAEAVSGINFD